MSREPETIEIPEIALDFSALDHLPTDQDLPSDDGEPLETIWHRNAMNLLIESIDHRSLGDTADVVGRFYAIHQIDDPGISQSEANPQSGHAPGF